MAKASHNIDALKVPPRLFTRREAVRTLAGASALALAGFVLPGCSRGGSNSSVDVLTVSDDAVTTLDAYSEIDDPKSMYKITDVAEFPTGTMFFSSTEGKAAALCVGETAKPLSTVSLVNLANGTMRQVLDKAQGHSEGYSIYGVGCGDTVLGWVESNYLTGDWRVYSAPINGLALGQVSLLDEGDANYDAPEITCSLGTVYWIVQPAEKGSKTKEDSLLKIANGGSVSTAYTSHGRFNGGLYSNGDTICAMPRADASGVIYQLTAFTNGAAVASQAMPRGYRPQSAIYLRNRFAFGIKASYDYGDGIFNVGTYYSADGSQWLRLIKTPITPPGYCRGWLCCKSGSRTVFVDMTRKRYFTIDAPSGTENQGDYPVVLGETNAVYNYATITRLEGENEVSLVVLRKIEPVSI